MSTEITDDCYASYTFPEYSFQTDQTVQTIKNSTKIKKRTYTVHATQQSYEIWTYDTSMLCIDELATVYQSRSVIFEAPQDQAKVTAQAQDRTLTPPPLLSFSPPRSISLSAFTERHDTPTLHTTVHCSECIEGVMVNLFYDTRISSWEIATKNAVGGHYTLFRTPKGGAKTIVQTSGPTVREMVIQALCAPPRTPLNEIPLLDLFDKYYSYSFVLQHPANPIVLSIQRPTLYLVAVYDVFEEERRAVAIPPPVFQTWPCFMNSCIVFPQTYSLQTTDRATLQNICLREGSVIKGLMLVEQVSGDRCFVSNPRYEELWNHRDLDPELQYTWLCVRHIGRTAELSAYIPRHRNQYRQVAAQYKDMVEAIYDAYVTQYVLRADTSAKNRLYMEYAKQIHCEVRVPSLRRRPSGSRSNDNGPNDNGPNDNGPSGNRSSGSDPIRITRAVIRDYMSKLSPAELLYVLNSEQRSFAMAETLHTVA